MGEYDRSSLSSSINYLGLFLSPAVSYYRENAHTATSTIDIALPGYAGLTPKLTAGGSLFHLLRHPALALLPAIDAAFPSAPEARILEHRVEVLRLTGSSSTV